MSKEFESEIAKKVSGRKKGATKAMVVMALCAAVLAIGMAATVVAAGNMNGDCDQTQDQLKDGSCEDTDCDGTPDQIQDQLQDGSCGDCDSICPNPDCPYSDE